MSFRHRKIPKLIPLISFIILLVLTPLAISFLQTPGGVEAAWVDDNFSYRNAIPITSHTAAENNVYITATIDTSASGQFQADCGDLRFTTVGGDTLPYYIVSGCVSASTVVHVFFKSMPAGAQTIYYYYGNPSAANGFSSADFSTLASSYALGSIASQEKGGAPIAYWKFDDGTGTNAQDSSPNNNDGTITGATWQTSDMCVSDKCLEFDGTDDYIDSNFPNTKIGTSNFSVAAWAKGSDPGGVGHLMIAGSVASYPNGSGWTLFWRSQDCGSNKAGFRLTLSGTNSYNPCSSSALMDDQWHHLVGVRDGTNVYFYVDGKLVDTKTTPSVIDINYSADVLIGRSADSANYMNGFIDDVKIYNYARTAAQIKADYKSRGTIKGSAATLSQSKGNSDALSNGLVGYWKMDEASWTNDCSTASVLDASGNGNTGKSCPASTGPTGGAAGKFGNAGSFDGVDDTISVTDSTSLDTVSSAFTVSGWIYDNDVDDGTNDYKTIIGKGDTGGNATNTFVIVLNSDKKIAANIGDGSSSQTITASTAVSYQTWTHVAITYDGTNIQIFRNGSSDVATTARTIGALYNSANLVIGRQSAGNCATPYFQCWSGKQDEVRIYNRALSPREVRDLYAWAPGPMIYYNFDEGTGTTTTYDRSGNGNNGTMNGSMTESDWVSGKYGKALDFDGSDDFVNPPGLSFMGSSSSEFTVSGWINPRVTAGTIFHNYYPTSGWSTGLVGFTGGKLSFNVYSLGFVTETGTTPTNSWTYVSLTRDASGNNKLYKNGILAVSNSGAYSSSGGANEIGIGRYRADCCQFDSPGWFNGKIDEVKVYNYARTQKQIVEDMNAGHPVGGSPVGSQVGYWRFDEGYGTTANNSGSGGTSLNGVVNNATWTNNGKFGKALSFDGTGDYVGITHNQGNNIKTVSVWFKLNSLPTGIPGGIVLANASSTSGPTGFDKLLRVTTSGKIEYYFHDGSGRNATGTTTLTTGVWYYAAGVTEGSRTVVYLNGKEEGSYASVSTNSSNYAIVDFDDTAYSSYAQDVNGVIDEVKLYNAALTSDEIALDYNRGQAMVLGTLSDTSGLTGGSIASSSASAEYCIPGDTATCTAPVARWDFEEKSGANAYDSSGNSNTASLANTTWSTGKSGASIKTNNSNSNIYVTDSTTTRLTSSGTVEAWVKPLSYPPSNPAWDVIIAKGDWGAGHNDYAIYYQHTADLLFEVRGATANAVITIANTKTPLNQWSHVSMTWDGSTVKVYVNGQYQNQASMTQNPDTTGYNLVMGQSGGGGNVMDGSIDQVRIFNYARSAAQVAWDYNRGAPVGHWRMDECQGATAKDSSGNGNTGTITIGASGTQTAVGTCTTSGTAWYNGVTGKFNSSLNFDGTDDYANTGDPSSGILDFGTGSFTISTWVKPNTGLTNYYEVISKKTTYNGSNVGWQIWLDYRNSGIMELRINDGSTANDLTPQPTTNLSSKFDGTSWKHAVWVVNVGNNVTFYVDGVSYGSQSISSMTGTISNAVDLNMAGKTGYYFPGQIDDVRIYNYALTASQVKTLFNGGAAVKFGPVTGSP